MTDLRLEDMDLRDISLVVFDLDGTLYNKRGLAARLMMADWRNILTLKAERDMRKQLRGVFMGDATAFYQALFVGIANLRHIPVGQAAVWYRDTYMPSMVRCLRGHYTAAPFLHDLLPGLQAKGIRIAVFSDYGCVEEKLEALGLSADMFDGVFDAPSLGGLKPCRKAFEALLRQMDTMPGNALMVGDRDDTDGEGARLVGMKFQKV